jgi:hypothetical protein
VPPPFAPSNPYEEQPQPEAEGGEKTEDSNAADDLQKQFSR